MTDTKFFLHVFFCIYRFICNTGSGFGYFQIKSKQKVHNSIAPSVRGSLVPWFRPIFGFGSKIFGSGPFSVGSIMGFYGLGFIGVASVILRISRLLGLHAS